MNWDTVQQFIRIIMQLLSGWLIGQGYLNDETAVTLTGAIISLAGVAWWAFWNKDVKVIAK